MKLFSFRFKITISLILVIASVSFLAFYLFNRVLSKIIEENYQSNIVSVLELLNNQYYSAKSQSDGRIIYSFLDEANKNPQIANTYLANAEGDVIYPEKFTNLKIDSLSRGDSSIYANGISIQNLKFGKKKFLRAFMRMQNAAKCYKCHSSTDKNLGFIVLDFNMDEARQEFGYTKKFSIYFTMMMVLVIVILIIFMHYKFVKKSLYHFESSIKKINQGNLNERVSIPETKELGELGRSFNQMISQFQQNQQELREYHKKELYNSNKLATIGEMAARLAHEIRNPITGIAGAIEIIVSESKDEEHIPVFEEIQRQAKRVNNVISDLLKYSKPKYIEATDGQINEILESLCFFLKNQEHDKNIEFKTDLDANAPIFKFDHEQIEDAFMNLMINAIHACKNGGSITLRSQLIEQEDKLRIEIIDTGVGVPDRMKMEIFKPFFTTRTEGTGLGLAIVKEAVDKHNGEIWIEDNKLGGSIFIIELPLQKEIANKSITL